jgi:hypothetical protein
MRLVIFALVLASFLTSQDSSAQQRSYDIMVEEGGKPLKRSKKDAVAPKKKSAAPKIPRGSGYIPSGGLPRTEAITVPSAPGVYKPPPINSFGDRTRDAIHSYPLQKGIGNNPTDQQMYIRQRAN